MEIWKDIPGYEGVYQVSNKGRVKALTRIVKYKDGRERHYKEQQLATYINCNGYLVITLNKNSKRKKVLLHRLIATAFIEKPEGKDEIDHINTIRTDNRIENLRWCTRSENINNPITKKKISNTLTGRKPSFIKEKKKIICLNTKEVFENVELAAQKYNLSLSPIRSCCTGVLKSAGEDEEGNRLMWKYLDEYNPEIDDFKEYRDPRLRRVRCIDTGEEFESIIKAAKKYNIKKGVIWKVCNGIGKTAGGKRWEYVN